MVAACGAGACAAAAAALRRGVAAARERWWCGAHLQEDANLVGQRDTQARAEMPKY